jgi:hypothetical protein
MLEPRFKGGLANASLTPQKCLLRRTLLLGLSSIAIIGCATSSTSRVTPERRAQIRAAADACLPEHPTVARYDIDHFGQVIAWYKENQGSTAATAPFFECVRARLASAPPAVASPPVSPAAAKAPRLALATPATVAAEQWPTMLPLPANVTIRPPAASVAAELLPFSGRWAGLADGGRVAAGLVVEELRPPAATVVVSLFSEGFGYTWRRDARIHPDVLMLSVEFLQGPPSVRYRLRSGGTLSMHFDNGGGDVTTMMSHRVP